MPKKANSPTTAKPTKTLPVPLFRSVRPARAFEEIATQIRGELEEGRLKVGSRLPAERVLAVQFGVSRNTLRVQVVELSLARDLEMRLSAIWLTCTTSAQFRPTN